MEAPAHSELGAGALASAEARGLLQECGALLVAGLRKVARTSLDTAGDLFEGKRLVSDQDELDFLSRRDAWLEQFGETLAALAERRIGGARRKGRRPDVDVSASTLRVLDPFDQEKQAGIAGALAYVHRLARKELDALDLRVAQLLGEPVVRDLDNPFDPEYIADAVGASARALFPHPRVWRPFMERVLADLAPAVPKTYITLNRLLADRGVLPDIKAALRARSTLRPENDRDLLPLFARLLEEAGPNIETINVEVPPILTASEDASSPAPPAAGTHDALADVRGRAGASQAATPVDAGPGDAGADDGPLLDVALPAASPFLSDPATRAAVAQTAAAWPATAPPAPSRPAAAADGFPSLDPMLALGSSSAIFEVLAQWQRFDPQDQATQHALEAGGVDTAALPLNRVPYLRIALGQEALTPTDRITMDVISLLFDYIFRDPSIPETTRGIFGRLQVPVLKAALLDRAFFSDRNHAARRLLDHLAAGAVGASSDEVYRIAFEGVAARVVDAICAEFALDLTVFDRADMELQAFLDNENRTVAHALADDIGAALDAEGRESDRAHAHALVRDRLAGLRLPSDVRLFAETAWADYLARVRAEHGELADPYRAALQTMDDLLWSITAKERTAQKARLTRMVPGIIASLRKGCAAVELSAERAKAFFDTIYALHIAAIKPPARKKPADVPRTAAEAPAAQARAQPLPPAASAGAPAVAAPEEPGPESIEEPAAVGTGGFAGTDNYHDYVSEMAVGTWLAFRDGEGWIDARLTWISPLRTKYIFTSRARTTAFVHSPEELAWELGIGRARLVLEPVPLFDRAVSAALDSVAARKRSGPETAAPALQAS